MENEKVKAIIVDGYKFPMHSDYVFDLKKVYTEEPSRTLNGSIPVFPSKIFIPYFTISYDIVPIKTYYEMMQRLQRDENVVEYYDSFAGEYKTSKFYAQQPTVSQYIALKGEYTYVRDLKIVFSGTLNDVSEITIEYNANEGLNAPQPITGFMGEEFKVDNGSLLTRDNYQFIGWNTMANGTGQKYVPNSIMTFTTNLTLYAQWERTSTYILSLNYGIGKLDPDVYPPNTTEELTSLNVKYDNDIPNLPEYLKVLNSDNTELLDKSGLPIYTFNGWFTLPNGEGTLVTPNTKYSVMGDSTVFANFIAKEYTVSFNSNGGSEFESVTDKYNTTFSLPKPVKNGKTFDGWYADSELTTKFINAKIPAENLTLYAKWKD